MKRLFKLLFVLLILIVAISVIAFFYINSLVKQGIEYGATYALGVETKVGAADIGVLSGGASLEAVHVANPEGFRSDYFLTLRHSEVAVTMRSLLQDKIEVPRILLDGVDLNLEKREGKANYSIIMESLSRFEKNETSDPSEGKKFVIRDLTIRDVKVNVDLLPVGGELTRQEVVIPEIRLTDVGSDSDKGVLVAELTDIALKAIIGAVIESGVKLPVAVLEELGQGLAGLASIGELGIEVVGAVGEGIGKVAEGVGKGAGGVVKGVAEGVGKGIGGLLGVNGKEDSDEAEDEGEDESNDKSEEAND